jgi:lipoyl(octanoyl) transferase
LRYFNYIVPCNIPDKGVTSLEQQLGSPVDMDAVAAQLLSQMSDLFALNLEELPVPNLLAVV